MRGVNSIVKRTIRADLCNRFDGRCAYCRTKIGMRGTIDHYLPWALGGTNAKGNLRWSCLACNEAKGDMSPEEWETRMPEPQAHETAAERRARLLTMVARRGLALRVR